MLWLLRLRLLLLLLLLCGLRVGWLASRRFGCCLLLCWLGLLGSWFGACRDCLLLHNGLGLSRLLGLWLGLWLLRGDSVGI